MFLWASMKSLCLLQYVTWPKPQNSISKHLNRNDNENKMYSAIDVPFIEWGIVIFLLLASPTQRHSPLPYALYA
jgi:hypothetical protein